MFQRGRDALQKEATVKRFRPIGKQTQRNLRRRTVMRRPQKFASRVEHLDGIAWRSIAPIHNIAGENPRMAAGSPVGRFAVYTYGSQVLSLQIPERDSAFAPD